MRTVFKEIIMQSLEWLSDYEFQKVAWFDNDQGLWYDYTENVEDIFECYALGDAFAAGEIVFDKETDQALRDLEKTCDALGYKWGGKEHILLESEGMAIVREMAKKCLKMIAASDGSQSTVKYYKPNED